MENRAKNRSVSAIARNFAVSSLDKNNIKHPFFTKGI